MKKLFFLTSIALLGFITTGSAQLRMDLVSGDRIYMPIPTDQLPLFYSWTRVSGNISFQDATHGSAIVYGSGEYEFIYKAVYSDHTNTRTVYGKFVTRGGGGGLPPVKPRPDEPELPPVEPVW